MDGVLLGSGGWFPTSRRQTCSALLRQGADVLVIDAGTGLQRILERPDLVEGAENVHVVLTHFHLDHVVGLSYVPGPASEPTTGGLGRRSVPRWHSRPGARPRLVRAQHASPGAPQRPNARVPGRRRAHVLHRHCTRSGQRPICRGQPCLLHEAWYAQSHDEVHSAGGDAGRIAREAGVEHLVLIHVNPLNDSDKALAESAPAEFSGADVGTDLATITLP